MTAEFIETYCKSCDRCIWERGAEHHFYPYPVPDGLAPTYCGAIDEDGGSGTPLTDIHNCIKMRTSSNFINKNYDDRY
jgi:hypothetical protein